MHLKLKILLPPVVITKQKSYKSCILRSMSMRKYLLSVIIIMIISVMCHICVLASSDETEIIGGFTHVGNENVQPSASPSETPAPTGTPKPTETPAPTSTPKPTETPDSNQTSASQGNGDDTGTNSGSGGIGEDGIEENGDASEETGNRTSSQDSQETQASSEETATKVQTSSEETSTGSQESSEDAMTKVQTPSDEASTEEGILGEEASRNIDAVIPTDESTDEVRVTVPENGESIGQNKSFGIIPIILIIAACSTAFGVGVILLKKGK